MIFHFHIVPIPFCFDVCLANWYQIIVIINKNTTTYKTVCKISQSTLYLTFLLWKFIDWVLVTIVDKVLIIFVCSFFDTLSAAYILSSQVITESLIILPKHSSFWQLHIPGFKKKIIFFLHVCCFEFLHSQRRL